MEPLQVPRRYDEADVDVENRLPATKANDDEKPRGSRSRRSRKSTDGQPSSSSSSSSTEPRRHMRDGTTGGGGDSAESPRQSRGRKEAGFDCSKWCSQTLDNVIATDVLLHLVIWALYLTLGVLFYSLGGGGTEPYGFSRGFYYTINVGYSVGWYSEVETHDEMIFSSLYCFLGLFVLAYMVIYFSFKIYLSNMRWDQKYHVLKKDILKHERTVADDGDNWFFCILHLIEHTYWRNYLLINTWLLVLIIIVFLWVWGCLRYGWDAVTGFYFAVGCLSTSGMVAISDDSPDVDFFVVAAVTAIGIPIINIGLFGFMTSVVQSYYTELKIDLFLQGMTMSELRALRNLQVDNGGGVFSPMTNNEYVVLIMMRMGILDSDTYESIKDVYRILDDAARAGSPPDVEALVHTGPLDRLRDLIDDARGSSTSRGENRPSIVTGTYASTDGLRGRQLSLIDLLLPEDQRRMIDDERRRQREADDGARMSNSSSNASSVSVSTSESYTSGSEAEEDTFPPGGDNASEGRSRQSSMSRSPGEGGEGRGSGGRGGRGDGDELRRTPSWRSYISETGAKETRDALEFLSQQSEEQTPLIGGGGGGASEKDGTGTGTGTGTGQARASGGRGGGSGGRGGDGSGR